MTDTLLNYSEVESWNDLALTSITYKNKNLEDWAETLTMPELDLQILDQVEKYNQHAIRLTELISLHCSLSKSSFYAAKAAYASKMHISKMKILEEIEAISTKRAPSQDALERLALNECLKEWRVMVKSEIVYEFWQTHSYKINQIHSRLTSLNIIKNIESRNQG